MIDRAVALDEEHRPGTEDLAGSYMQAATIQFRLGQAGADEQFQAGLDRVAQAKPIRAKLFGEQSAEMALCLGREAALSDAMGDQARAIAADEQALSIFRGGDLAMLATSLNNLGSRYLKAGYPEKAVPLLQDCLDIREDIYADVPHHSYPKETANWLAAALLVQGRAGQNPELRATQAKKICLDHGLSFEERQAVAENFPLEPVIELKD